MRRKFDIGDSVELVGTGYTDFDAFIVDIKGFGILKRYAVMYHRYYVKDAAPDVRVDWFFKGSLARPVCTQKK